MKRGVFVSGTDTGIGKTTVSSLLLAGLLAHRKSAGYFKPIQTGMDEDTHTVAKSLGIEVSEFPVPVYQFPEPIAPFRAALIHQAEIQLNQVLQAWKGLDDRNWVVEGAGGLLVPLNSTQTIRDLVRSLDMSLLIVSSTRLGTINHTLLTIESARAVGISIAGLVLVGDDDPGLESILEQYSRTRVLVRVPQIPDLTPSSIQNLGPIYFGPSVLDQIYAN